MGFSPVWAWCGIFESCGTWATSLWWAGLYIPVCLASLALFIECQKCPPKVCENQKCPNEFPECSFGAVPALWRSSTLRGPSVSSKEGPGLRSDSTGGPLACHPCVLQLRGSTSDGGGGAASCRLGAQSLCQMSARTQVCECGEAWQRSRGFRSDINVTRCI